MKTTRKEEARFDTVRGWVAEHAQKSSRPALFLNLCQDSLMRASADRVPLDRAPDYSDPLRLAAEIEALAAVRRVRAWRTYEGLCPWYARLQRG